MDKNAIKKYAVWARKELMDRVRQRAEKYEITIDANPNADSASGNVLKPVEKKQRQAAIARMREKGCEYVIEEVAYTWFNRFAALRYMEVNNYLPSRVRVFTDENGDFKPQILTEAIHLDLEGLNMDTVYALKEQNANEELYKYLLITQCNALSGILPKMFQKISDYTELLLPDNLLREGSVAEQLVTLIPEDNWQDAVEIIGWLYQYYISEKKDEVFAALKKNVKITRENIPAATQLFTPDWIVKYMVENSLGRLWLERHPNSSLRESWKYYLDEAKQTPEVEAQLRTLVEQNPIDKPEYIRLIDPCMGSGHILVYAFDVLFQIYQSVGYSDRDIPDLILENNIYGLDIDDRACQLAYFALMMKARSYNRRFFRREDVPQPQVYSPQGYEVGMEYGSLIKVEELEDKPVQKDVVTLYDAPYEVELNTWNFRRLLWQKYDVVVTNPPYMGSKGMSGKLLEYVKKNYPDGKSDMFAVFILRVFDMQKGSGFSALMTSYTWLFLVAYTGLREKLLKNNSLYSLIQPEYHSFFAEAFVPICTFVMRKQTANYIGRYIRLEQFTGASVQETKTLDAINDPDCPYLYNINQSEFNKIPNSPIAYWLKPSTIDLFETIPPLSEYANLRQGLITGDNDRFLRFWYECEKSNISIEVPRKWFFYHKGGEYRKWYGNISLVVNWENDGYDIMNFRDSSGKLRSRPQNIKHYLHEGFTWTALTVANFNARYMSKGSIFDAKGSSGFSKDTETLSYLIALCNSKPFMQFLSILAPTMDYNAGAIAKVPIIYNEKYHSVVDELVSSNITLSKIDWDSFETSWDFQSHPLINGENTLSTAFGKWRAEAETRFTTLKANEEELNRIFIDIYGLQDELAPEVEDKDVTVRKADLGREIRSFISYAVGCMFGRYSLDVKGLAYAGGEWDESKYQTFPADTDNILPLCDDEYFDDDVTGLFIKFIATVYGGETLDENLKFIADALGGKGMPKEVIRNYFLNDFFKDHCRIYQKRPIYWLFDSGKKNGFKALVYLHRYQPDTIARMRTDYVHEQQSRYRTAIADLENRIAGASTSERVRLNKQLIKLQDQSAEIHAYEEKIHHLADQMIAIDLDDGVKHNYEIFKDVLAKIK